MGGVISSVVDVVSNTADMFVDAGRGVVETVEDVIIEPVADVVKDTTESIINPAIDIVQETVEDVIIEPTVDVVTNTADMVVDFGKDTVESMLIDPVVEGVKGVEELLSPPKQTAITPMDTMKSSILGGLPSTGAKVLEEDEKKSKGISKKKMGSRGLQVPLQSVNTTTAPANTGIQV